MTLIFADRTARWVPFVTVALIVAFTWGRIVWENLEIGFATEFCLWFGLVLLTGVFAQGWLYWKGQVETLSVEGGRFEAKTMRWVGWGKRHAFAPGDATGWRTIAKSSDVSVLGSIEFTVHGQALSLSMLNPQVVNLDGLSALAPEFFAKVKADYPNLVSRAEASA